MVDKTISHYKILEKLGEGGMGIVYKAFDTKLEREVALKVLRPEAIGDPVAKKRFIREAKAASALNHPNITTIHEIDEWHGLDFICMEYVDGETIKKKIQSGQMSMDEILNIAAQVAEALQEAHEHDIIHRDIKSENIMVTPKGQVKVMDFGLAKLKGTGSLTKAGTTMGTISYMSPEQTRGEEVDHRTDIWSFGVVLYEMITGQLPFKGEYEQAVIYSIMNEMPEPIAGLRSDVPQELERIVDKALEKNEEDRYQLMEDMLIDLRQLKRDTSSISRKPIDKMESHALSSAAKMKRLTILSKSHKPIIAGFGLLGMIALLVAALLLFQNKESKLAQNRVVVATLENNTGDESLDRLGREAAEWVKRGLQRTAIVQVVPVTATLQSLGEAESERLASIRAIAYETGAGIVVSGMYFLHDETIWFQPQITDAKRNRMINVEAASGSLTDPMAVFEVIRQRVMAAIGHNLSPVFSESAEVLSAPPSYAAFQEWVVAIEAFHRQEWLELIHHANRAYELDTTYTASLLWAAIGHLNLGTWPQADSLAKLLERSRNQLSLLEQYLLYWLHACIKGDRLAAYRAAQKCRELSPVGKPAYQAGFEALKINRPRELIKIFKQIDPTRGDLKGFYSYWARLTVAYYMLKDYEQMLKDAQRARELYPDLLRALNYEVIALAALGRINDVHKLIDESLTMKPQGGWSPGDIMINAAMELRARGNREESFRVLNRAIAWYSEQRETKTNRYGLANAYYLAEQWPKAHSLLEKLAEEVPTDIDYKGFLGILAVRRGNQGEARRIYEWLGNQKQPYVLYEHIWWQAKISALLGEKERAMTHLREAFNKGKSHYLDLYLDIDLEQLRDYKPFRDLIKPKG